MGIPSLGDQPAQRLGESWEICDEISVRPVRAIVRFFGRVAQIALEPSKIEIVKQGSVEEDVAALATLGGSGDFFVTERQITDADGAQGGPSALQAGHRTREHVAIRPGNVGALRSQLDIQDERKVQASRALHHAPAATGPAQHGNGVAQAGVAVNFLVGASSGPEHDEIGRALPKTKDFARARTCQLTGRTAAERFGTEQQGFVERQVFFGRWKAEIKVFHGGKIWTVQVMNFASPRVLQKRLSAQTRFQQIVLTMLRGRNEIN